jgi:hypothetical protein
MSEKIVHAHYITALVTAAKTRNQPSVHQWVAAMFLIKIVGNSARYTGSCLQSQLLRGQRSGGWQFKAAKQKVGGIPISINKSGMVVHACHPTYEGGVGKRITVGGQPQTKS